MTLSIHDTPLSSPLSEPDFIEICQPAVFILSQLTIGSLGEGGHHTQILVPNHCIIISCHLIISYQNNPLIEGGYHTQILGTITSSCHHIILYNLYCWYVFRHEFSDIMMIWWYDYNDDDMFYDYNDDMMMICLVSFPDWWTVGTPLVIVSSLPASPRASPSLKASLYLSPWHISTVLLIWWWQRWHDDDYCFAYMPALL